MKHINNITTNQFTLERGQTKTVKLTDQEKLKMGNLNFSREKAWKEQKRSVRIAESNRHVHIKRFY